MVITLFLSHYTIMQDKTDLRPVNIPPCSSHWVLQHHIRVIHRTESVSLCSIDIWSLHQNSLSEHLSFRCLDLCTVVEFCLNVWCDCSYVDVCCCVYVCDRAVTSLLVLCWRLEMTSQIFPLTPPTISCCHNWVEIMSYLIVWYKLVIPWNLVYIMYYHMSYSVLNAYVCGYFCIYVQAGALITSVRWTWHVTHRLADWWQ